MDNKSRSVQKSGATPVPPDSGLRLLSLTVPNHKTSIGGFRLRGLADRRSALARVVIPRRLLVGKPQVIAGGS